MALFDRKQDYSNSAPFYTTNLSRSYLIVGLGNPEKKYDGSRHNIGFAVLDEYATRNDFPGWKNDKSLKSEISIGMMGNSKLILVKPQTYMNLSGEAVRAAQHFYKLQNKDILVVYDELAIPFRQLRMRVGGTDAGHNGVKSLIEHVGDDFNRLRIGISPADIEVTDEANFVLKKFSKEEKSALGLVVREACAIITEFSVDGQLPHDTRSVD